MLNLKNIALLFLVGCILLAACDEDSSRQDKHTETQSQGNSPANITSNQLLKASLAGKTNLIEEALKQDVDISKPDQSGRTPLMLASFNGHTEVVRLLLEHGADPQKTDNQGQAALSFAASGSFPRTAELLLKKGADPNQTDTSEGWSALMWAAAEGNEQVVKVLLDHGADPDLQDNDDETARDFAENSGHQKIAELLKQAESNN